MDRRLLTPMAGPFWESARRKVLSLQFCRRCEVFIHFPLPLCPKCHQKDELTWRPVSGEGTIYSFVVVHRTRYPEFAQRTPYTVACVELREQAGLRMFSNIVGTSPENVSIGADVAVVFEQADEVVVPQFRLVEAAGG
ncbi:MAG: Zn-ribbon domain-containing OB-fold protein [Acidimicrobiales bacterium]